MAESSGFFNAELVNGQYDREYLAEAFAKYFSLFIANGVFPNPSDGLQVFENTTADMNVLMHPGYAWIDGYWYKLDGNLTLAIDPADGVLNRIDSIVVRWDLEKRSIYAKVVKGTPASEPTAPEVMRSPDFSDLCVAHIRVDAGTTKIMQSMITDTRMNSSLCGIVTGVVQSIDTTTLFEQYQAALKEFQDTRMVEFDEWQEQEKSDFDTWFETIKGTLDGDTAGNLLNMIQQETTERKAADSAIESKLGINATAVYEESTVKITAPEGLVVVTFLAPSDCKTGDKYTLNGDALTLTDLNGEPVEDGWKQGAPIVFYITGGNRAFFKAGGMGKLPSDLAPLCPNFVVERNGTKVKISADKIQLNSYTNMVSGGVWAWGTTQPTKPTGENTKQWSRAELITTRKPYDGLYLGDVTPSDAVTETLIYLPENDSGKVKLVPFLVLSTDYLGGVYVMRKHTSKDFYGLVRNQNGSYFGGGADVWITNTYLNSVLGKNVSSALLDCEITTAGVKQTRKCWIPGMPEVGSNNNPGDGEKMPYFASDQRRIAYDEDTGTPHVSGYWTRTQASSTHNFSIGSTGKATQTIVTNFTCYRPSFVLPKDFKIQKRPDGSYTVWDEQGLLTLGDIEASDNGVETIVNIPTTSGLNAVRYTMKTYNEQDVGLMEYRNSVGSSNYSPNDRSKLLFEASNLYSTLVSTMDSAFSDSLKTLIPSVNVKLTRNSGSVEDVSLKYFILSLTEIGAELINGKVEGTLVPWYADPTKKAARGNGFTRTIYMAGSYYTAYCTNTSGNTFVNPPDSTHVIWPVFCLPLTAPIRALADGTYDLVPEDPALSAQSISTLADEEEVPLEIELDWPESDPLIARQWVYNEKGVYQTMLLGGVASTEDAPAYSPVLAENTWEQIAQACADRDPILDSWLVGDEKDEVINGETLTLVIVGKDHDDLADGSGKAPLTFGMKNLMAETRKMNSSNTNSGSFAGSAMYSWLSGTIYPNLPTELKDAIKAVNKKTSSGGGSSSIRTDPMYLWLFAEIEVFGYTTNSYVGEGTQYPYFATATERIKRLSNGAGAASYWWERSPYRSSSHHFCYVDASGSAHYNYANLSYGVCFGFCI